MGESALLLARALKLLAEIALLAGLGQWLLGWMLGPGRERNPVYGLFRVVTAPNRWLAGRLSPRSVRCRRAAAVLLPLGVWIAALFWKLSLCLPSGVLLCR